MAAAQLVHSNGDGYGDSDSGCCGYVETDPDADPDAVADADAVADGKGDGDGGEVVAVEDNGKEGGYSRAVCVVVVDVVDAVVAIVV